MKNKVLSLSVILMMLFLVNSCELESLFDDPRDNITGDWRVEEDSEIFKKKDMNRIYNVSVSKDTGDSTAFYIEGFYELNGKVKVIMDDLNLSIPDQTVDGFSIQQGSGSLSTDYSEMTFYYYVSFAGDRDVVSAIYRRPESR